jgi:SAM-dependent methyltransferase
MNPLNDWTTIARQLEAGSLSPRFAPSPDELAVHRAAHLACSGSRRSSPERALVLGATPELAALALSLDLSVLRVDNCPGMFAAARPRETWGAGQPIEDVHADWRDLRAIPDASVDLVLGDAALNNVAHADLDTVLAQLQRVLRPEGVLSLKEIVYPETWQLPPGEDAEVPDLAWALARHRAAALTQVEFRTLLRFWCFLRDAYDAPSRLLDGARVHEAVLREQSRGTFTEDEAAHLIATASPLKHTIHARSELQARLQQRFGRCTVRHAGPELHRRNLFQIFLVGIDEAHDAPDS